MTRIAGIVLAGLVAALVLAQVGCNETAATIVCRITDVKGGQVQVHRPAGPAAAAKGMDLAVGDRIVTGEGCAASLRFADFGEMVLGEKTEFVIKSLPPASSKTLAQTTGELLRGIGLVKVRPDAGVGFQVRTPHVVTGVLGTIYGIQCGDADGDADETRVACMEGKVRCDGGGSSVVCGASSGVRCSKDAAPVLMEKFFQMQETMNSFLAKSLQTFMAQDFGKADLGTVTRIY